MKILERIAYLLILAAAIVWTFSRTIAPWLMAVGALGVLATHLRERYDGENLRRRRIVRMRWLLGLFYCVTAYFMFKGGMEWLPFLCIAVVIELYTYLCCFLHHQLPCSYGSCPEQLCSYRFWHHVNHPRLHRRPDDS